MVRKKDPEKRMAIIQACIKLIADQGLNNVPTSSIAKIAGVAEGTIFSYFPNKSELYNAVYLEIRLDMFDSISQNYDATQPLNERFLTLFNGYLEWGTTHPAANIASVRLADSKLLTSKTIDKVNKSFPDLEAGQLFQNQPLLKDHPEFAEAIFTSLADTAITFSQRNPDSNEYYQKTIVTLIGEFFKL